LTSKIIIMAERIKDAEDRILESLFESAPIADDGFSQQIVRRVKRQLWVRRLTLPVAVVIGGLIAFKPLAALLSVIANMSTMISFDAIGTVAGSIPQLQNVLLGAILLGAAMLAARMLED
jgi:hypothetical protein